MEKVKSIKTEIAERVAALRAKGNLTEGERAFIVARRSYLSEDDLAHFKIDKKALDAAAKKAPADKEPEDDDEGVDLEKMTKAELESFAGENDVDLTGASTKADIIAKIEAALGEEE